MATNMHLESTETLALNLFTGGNSLVGKPLVVLAGARYIRLGYTDRPLAAFKVGKKTPSLVAYRPSHIASHIS